MKKTFTIIILSLVCAGVFGDEVKSVRVTAGDSVTLHTDLTEIHEDDVIWWRFGEGESKSLLAEIVKHKIWYARGRFRDKLQISDSQTGDLTIMNMKIKYSGLYEGEINIANGASTSFKRFNVTVSESPPVINAGPSEVVSFTVTEGESVTLPCNVQTQRDALILWRFGDQRALIAEGDVEDDKISYKDDGIFKDRLKMNGQTGDLIITDSKTKHTGVYQLKISSNKQTLYKTFSVTVRGAGMSSGGIAGLCFFLLLFAAAVIAAGLILYRRRVSEFQHEIKMIEGKSATLKTGITKIQNHHKIIWRFGAKGPIIAQIYKKTNDVSYGDEERFRNKLHLDNETGDLTINDVRIRISGDYHLEITRRIRITTSKTFKVVVRDTLNVTEGVSVKLESGISELQDDDQIQWRFEAKDAIIAVINGKSDEISINCDEEMFKNRLTLDRQTGSLTITNIKNSETGVYELQIKNKNSTSYKKFSVVVWFETLKHTAGDSVTLQTRVSELKKDHQLLWTFGDKNTRIAEINRAIGQTYVYDGDDERFRDRLTLNKQNGDLTIRNIRRGHSDVYKLQINSSSESESKSFILIVNEKWREILLMEGDCVTLPTDLTDIQSDEVMILWMFGPEESLIAKADTKKKKKMWLYDVVDEKKTLYDGADGRFKAKLQLDQTGSLTIKDISTERTGLYKLQIISKRETRYKRYRVSLRGNSKRDGTGALKGAESEGIPLLHRQTS